VRFPNGKPDGFFSAFYQSVISSIVWSNEIDSHFLHLLREHTPDSSKLSIKFVVDGVNQDQFQPQFSLGRVVGTIGLYEEEREPKHFVAGRYLRVTPETPQVPCPVINSEVPLFNYAPCTIDKKAGLLHLDLGNSLPSKSTGGPLDDVGPLLLAFFAEDGKLLHEIGEVPYLDQDHQYEDTASIFSYPITDDQIELARRSRIGIVGDQTVLIENEQAAFVRADNFVYRIEAGQESQPITLYATLHGHPAVGETVTLKFDNAAVEGQQKQGEGTGPTPARPLDILSVNLNGGSGKHNSDLKKLDSKTPPTVTTGSDGKVTFTLHGDDPLDEDGHPARGYIDGQVYGVGYDWEKDAYPNKTGSGIINVLVFNDYKCDGPPTWDDDVQSILQQYANLYPVMANVLDLGDYDSVVQRVDALQLVFSLPIHDPNYMPVTRDLSKPKRKMLLQWLDNPIKDKGSKSPLSPPDQAEPGEPDYKEIDSEHLTINSVQVLREKLQLAVELEHATIPPYLTALYSIMPGANQEVAEIIRSVVMEEMLHMALACNLLNAVEGSPDINKSDFVPKYPGPLPGGVAPGLTVHLRKCSKEQIRDVFMKIEEPSVTEYPVEEHERTIGWFYDQIKQAMIKLNKEQNIFTGDPDRQLKTWHSTGNLIAVHDLHTAIQAIDAIVEQGEGASPFNPEDGYDEVAHFYRFEEIVRGRRIVIEEDQHGNVVGYSFSGKKIKLDMDGVYDMPDDPDANRLPEGSQARMWTEEFNRSYGNLLNALHATFNGQPDAITSAIGLMFSLEVQAKKLMQPIPPPGDHAIESIIAGPSFQIPASE
jgi:hypothetical protein